MQSETWTKQRMNSIGTGWPEWLVGTEDGAIIWAFREEDADRIIADHTAASTLRTALTEALADIEAGIKDDTLPPQYVLGLAYAMGRLTDPRIPALAVLHTPTGAGTAEAN